MQSPEIYPACCDTSFHEAAALLLAWRGGDTAAGRMFVVRHERVVARFFRAYVGEPEVLRLTHQVFRTFYNGTNRVRDVRVELYRHAYACLRVHLAGSSGYSGDVSTISGDAGCTPTVRDEQRPVQAALQQLTLAQRVLLELRHWEGLTRGELAAVFELPVAEVERTLRSASREFHAKLHPECEDERAVTRVH